MTQTTSDLSKMNTDKKKIICKFGGKCARIHIRTHYHSMKHLICRFHSECKDKSASHRDKFFHRQICRFGTKCNDASMGHQLKFEHLICTKPDCKGDKKHFEKYVHYKVCELQSICSDMTEKHRKEEFHLECPYFFGCNLKDPEHYQKYNHAPICSFIKDNCPFLKNNDKQHAQNYIHAKYPCRDHACKDITHYHIRNFYHISFEIAIDKGRAFALEYEEIKYESGGITKQIHEQEIRIKEEISDEMNTNDLIFEPISMDDQSADFVSLSGFDKE